MKIKVYSFPKEDILRGFKPNEVYEVSSISISGDYCAYDMFYKIINNIGQETSVFDLCCEIVEQEKEIEQLLKYIENTWRNTSDLEIPYKFRYDINIEDYINFRTE